MARRSTGRSLDISGTDCSSDRTPPERAAHSGGTLYVVSVPLGDPDDVTLRALRVLRAVELVVCETRVVAAEMLRGHGITTLLLSTRPRRGAPALAAALSTLKSGGDVALICDSGTPTIADPGGAVVRAAVQIGLPVTSVPGASACLAALALSGFPSQPFVFLGTPPASPTDRADFFARMRFSAPTLILYESRRRLRTTLAALGEQCGIDAKIVVACELSHSRETVFRGTILMAISKFSSNIPPGAYTLVIYRGTDSSPG